ncbi:hypothetical protein ACQ4PT_016669 [Festuca glaucescens]
MAADAGRRLDVANILSFGDDLVGVLLDRKDGESLAQAYDGARMLRSACRSESGDLKLQVKVKDLWRQCLRLWEAVETVERDTLRPDRISWKGTDSGAYSAKVTYRMLCLGSVRWSMNKPVWGSFSPMKCKMFAWLALKYRLWTSDRRARHGLQDRSDACYTCLQGEDNVDHALVLCPYARQVWCRVLHSASLRIEDPGFVGNLQRWWTEARKRVRRIDRKRFDTMTICTAWTIWKQRNARTFGNVREQKSVDQMVVQIRDEFHLWERAKRGGRIEIARE